MSWLDENEIERALRDNPSLEYFWKSPAPLLIFRSQPIRSDPIYEIQLAFDLGDRLETWRWLWVEALSGRVVRQFPP